MNPEAFPCLPETLFSALDREFAGLMERLAGGARPELRLAAALVSRARGEGDVCLDLAAVAGTVLDANADADPGPELRAPALAPWLGALRAADSVVGAPGEVKPLVLDARGRLYLRRYWCYEQQVAAAVRARGGPGLAEPENARADAPLAALLTGLFPAPAGAENWPAVAALAAVRSRLCVLTGGPGTGKTTTVVRLLALLAAQSAPAPLRAAIAAPTGKAAARLQESLRAQRTALAARFPAAAGLPDDVKTIHRLLGPVPGTAQFRHGAANPLAVDVLVVDEASMVDLALMAKLLAAVPPAARIVLLGDRDQLAAVEAGNVLGDLAADPELNRFSPGFVREFQALTGVRLPERAGPASPLGDGLVQLRRSHRFPDAGGIARVSRAVNHGDAAGAFRVLQAPPDGSVAWRELPARAALKDALRGPVLRQAAAVARAPDAAAALAALGEFRLLAAVREGTYGVATLNALAGEILREAGLAPRAATPWYRGRPVLVTANEPAVPVFNGDLGLAWPDADGTLAVWFPTADGPPRRVAPARLPAHETAHALTVHKSQGSEFGEVLLLLPARPVRVLSRELVYTGLTRAARRTELWAPADVFRAAVARRTARASGLREQLWGAPAGA